MSIEWFHCLWIHTIEGTIQTGVSIDYEWHWNGEIGDPEYELIGQQLLELGQSEETDEILGVGSAEGIVNIVYDKRKQAKLDLKLKNVGVL